MICDYGCGQEAKYTFKNKKNCCSKMTTSCPGTRKRSSASLKKNYKEGRRKFSPKKKCEKCGKYISISNFERHNKKCGKKRCPVCDKPTKFSSTTCSKECRLIHFGPPNLPDPSKLKGYRVICFRYHKKRCIICNEKYFIEAHHYDENRENSKPENLVPLCILHHKYIHHRKLKYVIKECVDEYVFNFTKRNDEKAEIS